MCEVVQISPSNHLPSSVFLPTLLSCVGGPGGLVWQAEHGNCRESDGGNVKPLWCFKHVAAVGRTWTDPCSVSKWGLSTHLTTWFHYLNLKRRKKYWITSSFSQNISYFIWYTYYNFLFSGWSSFRTCLEEKHWVSGHWLAVNLHVKGKVQFHSTWILFLLSCPSFLSSRITLYSQNWLLGSRNKRNKHMLSEDQTSFKQNPTFAAFIWKRKQRRMERLLPKLPVEHSPQQG